MTQDEQATLAALAVVGVAAALVLLRPETRHTGASAAPGGPITGTGGGDAGPAPEAPGDEPGVIEQLTSTVQGWLTALGGGDVTGAGPIPFPSPTPERSPTEWRSLMRPLFRRQEKAYAMPVGLLEGIADRESRFRHDIVSGQLKGGVGEAGVMQLHPAYHLSDDRERIDPNIAIPYAAKYLAQNFLKFGTWEEAIAAYNWGPGNLERSGLQAAPTATKEYIAWVKDRGYVEGFV